MGVLGFLSQSVSNRNQRWRKSGRVQRNALTRSQGEKRVSRRWRSQTAPTTSRVSVLAQRGQLSRGRCGQRGRLSPAQAPPR